MWFEIITTWLVALYLAKDLMSFRITLWEIDGAQSSSRQSIDGLRC